MQDQKPSQEAQSQLEPKPRSFVSERLLKGMTDEEIKQFEGSYLRAKRVLKRINEYAEKEGRTKLNMIDDPKSLNAPNYDRFMAWASGYRYAMRVMQELTRT
jgi:hypothetical protein